MGETPAAETGHDPAATTRRCRMNRKIKDLPPDWYVFARVPDGRVAVAQVDDPIVAALRRLIAASAANHRIPWPGKPADYAAVTDWLDAREPLPVGQLALWREAA